MKLRVLFGDISVSSVHRLDFSNFYGSDNYNDNDPSTVYTYMVYLSFIDFTGFSIMSACLT